MNEAQFPALVAEMVEAFDDSYKKLKFTTNSGKNGDLRLSGASPSLPTISSDCECMARAMLIGTSGQDSEAVTLTVNIKNIGEMAVLECKGRIVRSEAAFKLRKAVTSQPNARVVVLDLSEVHAIHGGGLGMLWFLQQWAHDHNIQLSCSIPVAP